jgi:hypothetical protein
MRNDRSMKIVIAGILIFFTIIQVFYFAQVQIIPTGLFTKNTLVNLLVFLLEVSALVALSILITYLLPIVCVVKTTIVFTGLKEIEFPKVLNKTFCKIQLVFNNIDMIQKLQVIRC